MHQFSTVDIVSAPLRVLIVEDSERDAELLASALERCGYDVTYECVQAADEMKVARRPWVKSVSLLL